MVAVKKLAKFGIGILAGSAVGAALGTLTAPEEGESFRRKMKQHFSNARRAGNEAKSTTASRRPMPSWRWVWG
jgi:gas vesicle protein